MKGVHVRVVAIGVIAGVIAGFASTAGAVGNDLFPQSVASGDPRPASVVLWTRFANPEHPYPATLHVEVASDEAFTDVVFTRRVQAVSKYDYCVKVKITGLDPYTTYYYRFLYGEGAAAVSSPVGRTRTAPAPGWDQPVRFAVVYCQDYVGRYYNSYLKLLRDHDQDLDFVVHLGDYIYETTDDPLFQDPSAERGLMFDDVAGAIPLGDPDDPYYAASSLDNYRQLYRTYRSDPVLQEVHERWPFFVIWDDHEFSDDSYGATATYFDERVDEESEDRRRNAERAFLEWIPNELGISYNNTLDILTLDIPGVSLYPHLRIWRDFRYGQHLQLILTDYRSYRPDHLIPESAIPGTVALDEATLSALLGTGDLAALGFDPYLDFTRVNLSVLRQIASLLLAAGDPSVTDDDAKRLNAALRGNFSATILEMLYAYADQVFPGIGIPFVPFTDEEKAAMPHGLPYFYLGKSMTYSQFGSRYWVLHDSYQIIALEAALRGVGTAESVYGSDQWEWLVGDGEEPGALFDTDATWRVFTSSVSMTPMVLDFSNPNIAPVLPPEFPNQLRTRLTLSVDQWDGFPVGRAQILGYLAQAGNSVVVSGDIHASFVTDHGNSVFEFTPPAVSSSSLGETVLNALAALPELGQVPGIESLVAMLPTFIQVSSLDDENVSPSDIVAADTWSHGYGIFDAGADTFHVTLMFIASEEALTSYYDWPDTLDLLFTSAEYVIQGGQLTPVATD